MHHAVHGTMLQLTCRPESVGERADKSQSKTRNDGLLDSAQWFLTA